MITTLTGPNIYLLGEELRKSIKDFVAENGDLSFERIDSEEIDLQRIIEAIQALPFLAARRLVVLKSPSTLKAFTEQFEELLKSVPDTTDLIIVEPKVDKRLSYYKQLQKLTNLKVFNDLSEEQMQKWLTDYAKGLGGSINYKEAFYLINRLGLNQLLLANEIKKLVSYQPNITKESIDLLTEPTPQSTVFNLLDAALGGEYGRTIKLYEEQRALKVEPFNILGMVAWQLHILALLKTAGERSVDEIAKESGTNPYVLRKGAGIAGRLSLTRLKELLAQALKLDIRLKSENIDADEALQNYLLKLAS